MSTRYSTSPALHLRIADSKLCKLLHGLLCLCSVYCLYAISLRGYPVLALGLLLPVVACCLNLGRQRGPVTSLSWCAGDWMAIRDGVGRRIVVRPGHVCLPWVVYLAWDEQPDGGSGSIWLYPDSAPAETLRRLRLRLALER